MAETLSKIIRTQLPLEVVRSVRLACSLCDAVEILRNKGQSDGVIYPHNIRIENQSQISERVVKVEVGSIDSPEAVSYLSPETAEQQKTGEPQDIYSIGVILYELLTASVPFTASSLAALAVQQLLEKPLPLRTLRPEIPEKVEEVVLRAIGDVGSRPNSYSNFRKELEASIEGLESSRTPAVLFDTPTLRSAAPAVSSRAASPFDAITMAAPKTRPLPSPTPVISAPAPAYTVAQPAAVQSKEFNELPVSSSSSPTSKRVIFIGLAVLLTLILLIVVSASVIFFSFRKQTLPTQSPTISQPATEPSSEPATEPKEAGGSKSKDIPLPPQPAPTVPVPEPTPVPTSSTNKYLIVAFVAIFLLSSSVTAAAIVMQQRKKKAQNRLQNRPEKALVESSIEKVVPVQPGHTEDKWLKTIPIIKPAKKTTEVTAKDEPKTAKLCKACGKEYPITAQFCVQDGSKLTEAIFAEKPPATKDSPSFQELDQATSKKTCPKCNTDYPISKKFCRFDGHNLIVVEIPDAKTDKPDQAMPPITIGQYSCFAKLGEGGMGMVYKARHIHLERLSAVKVLLPQTALNPDAIKLFRREAKMASSINHPNSVTIYDYGELGTKLFYLAMEYIEGKTLADLVHPKGSSTQPFSQRRAINITLQICDALDAAHQAGIVHRDLKPQNVMVSSRPNRPELVKVLDFGIARSLKIKGEETLKGIVVGTPAYMSPEQAAGDPDLEPSSDIFSLGLVIYQMLTGSLPFNINGLTPLQQVLQRAAMLTPVKPIHLSHPSLKIHPSVSEAISRALEPDKNRRIQTVAEFMKYLEAALEAAV
ncbi:MAG: protein kinase [Blastocatellia bacterium]|nr:protein kinase [Blastocatellia bacterium]